MSAPAPKNYTIHVYRDSRGEWRWRMKARNGRIVADSGEGYGTERKCLRAAEALQKAQILIAVRPA